nr:acyltransferase [Clostridium chromiireducens]
MKQITRRYDLDWLRTIGVLLVIPFHSLLMFNMDPGAIVYVKDTINVKLFNILDRILHSFHMPLLFIIAGMSVYFSLQCRTKTKYINERVRKLLIPSLFGCIILNPVMTYIYLISKNENVSFLNHLLRFFTKNPGDFVGLTGAFTPAHLWFVIYLLIFSLVGLPFFMKISKGDFNNLLFRLGDFLEKPLMLILAAIPVTIFSAINILGDKNPLVYFAIFFIGFLIAADDRYQKSIIRDKWIYLILSIIFVYLKFNIPHTFETWSPIWCIYGIFNSSTTIVSVFALLGLANRFINKNTRVLDYLSKASFPVYIIHMLINTMVGFCIIKLNIIPEIKFILIVVITFTACFLVYEFIKRVEFWCYIFAIKSEQKLSEEIKPKEIYDETKLF